MLTYYDFLFGLFLEKTCDANKVYVECGPACTSVCGLKGTNSICKKGCIDGCHCPQHMSLSNGVCVPNGECPCQHNGEEHKHGVSVKMNECIRW